MKNMTGSDFSEKWARRLSGATDDIRKGVEAVTEAPGRKAAAKKAKWVAKMTAAETQEKWARNVGAIPLEEWRAQVINKGIPRVSAGVEGARDKMTKFGEQLLAYQSTLLTKVSAMPDVTLADSEARMIEWMRGMAKFKPSK